MKNCSFKVILLLATSLLDCYGQANPRVKMVELDFLSINSALNMYKINAGMFPSTEQGLEALREKPQKPPIPKRWMALVREVPKDPWGRHYQYRNEDGKIHLWSKGRDEDDASDDIVFEAPDGEE